MPAAHRRAARVGDRWRCTRLRRPAQPRPRATACSVCAAPRRRVTRRCLALKLAPSSPHPASIPATPTTGSGGPGTHKSGGHGSSGATPAVDVKSPFRSFLTPQDLHAAYALPTETASSPSQTVAVIDAFNDPTIEADLGVYDEQFGLPPCTRANGCFRELNQHGQLEPAAAEERRLGVGDIDRRRDGPRDLPELSGAARRGRQRKLRRPQRRRRNRRRRRRDRDQQLVRCCRETLICVVRRANTTTRGS